MLLLDASPLYPFCGNVFLDTPMGYSGAVTTPARQHVRLELEGMSCASCAAAIERRLNELDGVEATVNLATNRATVSCTPAVEVGELVSAVESIGYGAHRALEGHDAHVHDEPLRPLVRALAFSAFLTVPVVLLAMIPALEFRHWGWVALGAVDARRLRRRCSASIAAPLGARVTAWPRWTP